MPDSYGMAENYAEQVVAAAEMRGTARDMSPIAIVGLTYAILAVADALRVMANMRARR